MSLPSVERAQETVILSDGQTVTVRALSFAAAYEWDDQPTPRAKLVYLIARATDSTEDEVDAWVGVTSTADVAAVSEAAVRVSGLGAAEGEGSRGASSAARSTRSPSSSPPASG